jgi:hypothetical protein
MKTPDLIALLASDPLPSRLPAWHLPAAGTTALVLSLGLVVGGWGLHANLPGLVLSASYQVKSLWLLGLALGSGVLLWRAARPARTEGYSVHAIGAFLLIMAGMGAYTLWHADPADRLSLLMGQSWWSCPLSIALIALPWLAVGLMYLRQMAPTRPAWSGASAGFLSGAVATVLYSLHCTETSYAFFSVWYVAGMGLSTAVGALLGRRYLRW